MATETRQPMLLVAVFAVICIVSALALVYTKHESRKLFVELEELTGFLRGRGMAVFKLPEKLAVVDALPYNATGKIQRRDVKAFFE